MKKKPPVYVDPSDNSSEYRSRLSDAERDFITQFDLEFHGGTGGISNPILTKPEDKVAANRNGNSSRRDALSVSKRQGTLIELDETSEMFMKDASDEWDWRNCYHLHGFKAAVEMILHQTLENMQGSATKKIVLLRFFDQMTSLMREYNYDRRQKRNPKGNIDE